MNSLRDTQQINQLADSLAAERRKEQDRLLDARAYRVLGSPTQLSRLIGLAKDAAASLHDIAGGVVCCDGGCLTGECASDCENVECRLVAHLRQMGAFK